jgi:hypothetical protein
MLANARISDRSTYTVLLGSMDMRTHLVGDRLSGFEAR